MVYWLSTRSWEMLEFFDVEETLFANGGDEGAHKLLLVIRSRIEGGVDGDQVGPVKVGPWSRV